MNVMIREGDRVLIFHTVHRVMKGEQVLKAAGADILLVPAPRVASSDCGLAIRVPPGTLESVLDVLEREGVPPKELWLMTGGRLVKEEAKSP